MKRPFCIFLAICLALSLCACKKREKTETGQGTGDGQNTSVSQEDNGQKPNEPLSPVAGMRVAYISKLPDDPLYAAAKTGAQSYAAQWGIELQCADGMGQLAAVQMAIDNGVDAICITADPTPSLEEKLSEAAAAGICIATWDTDVSPELRTLTVSEGMASVLGSMLVEMGVTSLKERGKDVGDEVLYAWHSTRGENEEESARYAAAREYIRDNYPKWVEYDGPYYSGGDQQSSSVGGRLLDECPGIDLVLCGDPEALLGRCLAAQERGVTAESVTITGFCPPSAMLPYLSADVCTRWGLWDCGMQSAMCCYLAAWLAAGNEVQVGDVVNIPRIGSVEILANSAILSQAETLQRNNGVVMLPERLVFTAENAYDFIF
ncbi:MAG: substrate-binding domain-containing protein [Oscillospiraceae bacterium]|nr:substrate-binding domain-containing protein [Oscillospiraceae bacterium]